MSIEYNGSFEIESNNELIENNINDDNKKNILSDINNCIFKLVDNIDNMINDVKNNKVVNLMSFVNINNDIMYIKKLVSDNNVNMDIKNLQAINQLEELNNIEYKNESLIKIGASIYKKSASKRLYNKSLKNYILNKNLNNDIFDKLISNNLIERFQARIYILSFNNEL